LRSRSSGPAVITNSSFAEPRMTFFSVCWWYHQAAPSAQPARTTSTTPMRIRFVTNGRVGGAAEAAFLPNLGV